MTWHRPPTSAVLPVRLPVRTRLRHLAETVRWAPAPYFEGSARQRLRFVGYVLGSMLAWTVGGLVVLAAVGRALASI
ncbi:chemotaxis protein CheW [Cellulomonas sp. S1-8]|uniref:chemotaxis protein CheW n=1 Tax=Cellulomonas sp. S1-8 TaxID=2904790 RepID=UPI00224436D4|nr:chemotaxis protein CheW [Cellulomonas sp. S1-8]UZN03844.1 chemotaxis protein CheW [Cellulomonas sp. S1-8]